MPPRRLMSIHQNTDIVNSDNDPVIALLASAVAIMLGQVGGHLTLREEDLEAAKERATGIMIEPNEDGTVSMYLSAGIPVEGMVS